MILTKFRWKVRTTPQHFRSRQSIPVQRRRPYMPAWWRIYVPGLFFSSVLRRLAVDGLRLVSSTGQEMGMLGSGSRHQEMLGLSTQLAIKLLQASKETPEHRYSVYTFAKGKSDQRCVQHSDSYQLQRLPRCSALLFTVRNIIIIWA